MLGNCEDMGLGLLRGMALKNHLLDREKQPSRQTESSPRITQVVPGQNGSKCNILWVRDTQDICLHLL